MSTTDPLIYEDRGAVRWLTVARPEVRNALNKAVLESVIEAVHTAEADTSVAALVIRGAGDVFSSGLDLKEVRAGIIDGGLLRSTLSALRTTPVPTIAAVNGAAVTAGMGFVLACDFAVASNTACFADSHGRIGLLSGSGITTMLIQRVGLARAKDLFLTARMINASTAERWGLVNDVVASEQLEDAVTDRAERIAQNSPALMRATVQAHQAAFEEATAARFMAELAASQSWFQMHQEEANWLEAKLR